MKEVLKSRNVIINFGTTNFMDRFIKKDSRFNVNWCRTIISRVIGVSQTRLIFITFLLSCSIVLTLITSPIFKKMKNLMLYKNNKSKIS